MNFESPNNGRGGRLLALVAIVTTLFWPAGSHAMIDSRKCDDVISLNRAEVGCQPRLCISAEMNFDAWREDKGEHTGGIPRSMLRMLRVPQSTKQGAKGAWLGENAHGNITAEQKTVNGVQYMTQYPLYNKNRVLKSIIYPSGREVNYTLDGADRITQVSTTLSGNSKTLASSITYVPFGGVTSLSYGNGFSLKRAYDNQYRVTSVVAGSVVNLTYGYDGNGNVISLEDAINPPPGSVYGFTGTYTTQQGTNKLTNIDTTPTAFGYDGRGNITSENARTYEYDSLNRLIKVKDNGVTVAEYIYNGTGQRIKKVASGVTKFFHYDLSGHIIAETDASTNQTLAEYVYLEDNLLAMVRQGNVYYFHNNNLGTPQILTDGSGNVVWKALYNPFGMAQITVKTVENPFRLPGQYYDAETGLHYNGFRYYHPKIGRYLTPDPIGLEGGINLWAYVAGNPVGQSDPTGLIPLDTIWDVGNIIWDIITRDWQSLAWDTAAAFIPYVPAGVTKASKVCKVGRGLDDILKESETFNRFLRRKHPVNQPYSVEDSKKIWDKIKESGLNPIIDQGHSTRQWSGPHINVRGTSIHIPVDPRFKP
jgi:RHS repeat-associated protein